MSRYIDADNLQRHGNRGGIVYWRDIEAQPTANVRENVKGKWIDINDENAPINYACSVCGAGIDYRGFANYCPNCGADMRGET